MTAAETTEAELVRRASDGDGDAVAALLAAVRPGVVRYCRASLGHIGGAYNKVADAQRAALRSPSAAPMDTLPERADRTPGPEQRAIAADLARRLSGLLDRLSDTSREIVVLRVAVGLSAEEVGSVLGMSATAVRVAQCRALAQLRKLAPDVLNEVPV
ncbi:MAG: hypothetical protein AUI14_24050 [Actinobacteria bacterium 13_2_20CM_2_71_6]|nr:MAG: hypothetical protein AUI14_24050 [Actinobacteria bacterium 13_2_20CM_2_71_6]